VAKKKWIPKDMKKGALRATTKTAKGKNISAAALDKAAHSKDPTTRKRAALAKTLKKLGKKRKKK
jgi:hypothetical protein